MRTWPTLFKKTSKGKDQQWDLAVVPCETIGTEEQWPAVIRVKHGQVGGKIQTSSVYIDTGKNLGKANATTPVEQAVSEADSKWLKQKDKGYSEEMGGASLDLKPMLAHEYQKAKVTFPSYVQPKLDGVRCIAHCEAVNLVRLFSRQGKEFSGLTHIKSALASVMKVGDVWDGELYVHGMPFQRIISLVKKDREESKAVEYHVYDAVSDEPFSNRFLWAINAIKAGNASVSSAHLGCLRIVETMTASSHEDVEECHEMYVSAGYEGAILRVGDCTYARGHRSRQLLKVKAFTTDEFKIVGVEEGKGKFEGRAVFVCETAGGTRFNAVPRGRDELRQRYFQDREKLVGEMLTVRFFEWTTSDPPVPRFPVAIAVRDYE